jgi:hypothetical protein
MDNFQYNDTSSVSYLNSLDGIQFDGRSYALYGMINKTLFNFLYYIVCLLG